MQIDLPSETWGVLLGAMLDDPIPRRVQFQAIAAFQQALQSAEQANKAAQQPPASDDKESMQ